MFPRRSLLALSLGAAALGLAGCRAAAETDGAAPLAKIDPCAALAAELEGASELRLANRRAEARSLYRQARARADPKECPLQTARLHNGLAALDVAEGRLLGALDEVQSASELLQALDGTRTDEIRQIEASIAHNRAAAYLRLGRLGDAEDILRGVLFLDRHGSSFQATASTRLQLARVHRLSGDPSKARGMLEESLVNIEKIAPKTQAALWQEHARLDLDERDFKAAREHLGRALTALESTSAVLARANLTADLAEIAVLERRWPEGLERVDEALDLARRTREPDLNLAAHARYLRSRALAGLGRLEEAIKDAEEGLEILEAIRDPWRDLGLDFFAPRQKYYRHRLDLAVASGDRESALAIFERYRARGLYGSLSRRIDRPALEPEAEEELLEKRRLFDAALQALDALPGRAGEASREKAEAVFRRRSRELRSLQREHTPAGVTIEPLEATAAVDLLDDDTLGLILARGLESWYLLVVDPRRGVEIAALASSSRKSAEIEARAERLIQALEPTAGGEARALLEPEAVALGALFNPVAQRLHGFERLAIVAEGSLERLPFALLRLSGSHRPLVASHEIVDLPSFSVLAALRRRGACPPPAAGLLALGDPVLSSRDPRWPAGAAECRGEDEAVIFGRLEESDREVESIAALYSRATVALGFEATLAHLIRQASKHRVIHLASHARSDPEVAERSKVMLSCIDAVGRSLDRHDLYLADVDALELCGQLVILSACDTARGRAVDGEGVLGLPRAFLDAGAAAVMASRWMVADAAAPALMETFHGSLVAGLGPAAALRRAQLELLERGRPASEWAAFTVTGDWRTFQPFAPGRVP